jgi:hypothetical protein
LIEKIIIYQQQKKTDKANTKMILRKIMLALGSWAILYVQNHWNKHTEKKFHKMPAINK